MLGERPRPTDPAFGDTPEVLFGALWNTRGPFGEARAFAISRQSDQSGRGGFLRAVGKRGGATVATARLDNTGTATLTTSSTGPLATASPLPMVAI